ncbi:hypothetical protein CBC_0090 [Clostridium botulinum C str. Eklund]|nr:hypothetical protein CBC_0090 [Clostridium botulinum C str. Eklund]
MYRKELKEAIEEQKLFISEKEKQVFEELLKFYNMLEFIILNNIQMDDILILI